MLGITQPRRLRTYNISRYPDLQARDILQDKRLQVYVKQYRQFNQCLASRPRPVMVGVQLTNVKKMEEKGEWVRGEREKREKEKKRVGGGQMVGEEHHGRVL